MIASPSARTAFETSRARSRAVLSEFDEVSIEIASATSEIVGVPALPVEAANPR